MLSKYKIGAEDESAPIAMCGYFNRNQAANTAIYIYIASFIKFLIAYIAGRRHSPHGSGSSSSRRHEPRWQWDIILIFLILLL